MADILKGLFGGSSEQKVVNSEDADFADFASAPEPAPIDIQPISPNLASDTPSPLRAIPTHPYAGRPFTAWYRVWERTTPADFYQELFILPFILGLVAFHLWGTRKNKAKARSWVKAHLPILQQEFSVVGFAGRGPLAVQDEGAAGVKEYNSDKEVDALIKQKKADEFATYATGRQNVAFVDVRIELVKRYNPLLRFGEILIGFFLESMPTPYERVEAQVYPFDGREAALLVGSGPEADAKGKEIKKAAGNSGYDGFVFAIVHKDLMKRVREDRYDLSLTATKDHAKLPVWVTVMSEAAEITDTLLTPELVKAIEAAGDDFEQLVISDMPTEAPRKTEELAPKKRLTLALRIGSSYETTLPIFQAFIRLADVLANNAHFRPEALRRVKQTREEEFKKLKKLDDDEKAEDRKLTLDKGKKEKRDATLKSLSAEGQKKYLEKERAREDKKRQKRQTVKA